MAGNTTEKSIVTTEAFKNFIDTFKRYIYDWTDPSNIGTASSDTTNSDDNKTKDANGIEGIVVATNKDIDDLFE